MSKFWIEKHKPKKFEEFVGNKNLQEIIKWFDNWRPGKALLIHGPTGVGKTLSIELISEKRNFQLIRLNSNEVMNKAAVESLISGSKNLPLFYSGKIILIDELEGLTGIDKGTLSAIVNLIKESKFPVVLITTDPFLTKFSALRKICDLVKFGIIPSPSINKRLKDICKLEGIEIDDSVSKSLARFSGGDLRSAINDLEMVSKGRNKVTIEDFESLGYREKEFSVFNVLPTIFRSGNISTTKNIIDQTDKDPDEIFWWVESNITKEFRGQELIHAYETLSKADMYRGLVKRQQNWRFKRISIDIFSGISLGNSSSGFAKYNPPQRFLHLGRTKFKRALQKSVASKMSKKLHCSNKVIKTEYFPYMDKFIKKNPQIVEQLKLEKDDMKAF